jgi:hypothetical protein
MQRLTSLPAPLRTLKALRTLNIVGVGASLGAVVGAVLGLLFGPEPAFGVASGASSFLVGMAWARLLRSKRTLWRWRVPVGWAAAVPLAIVNAMLAISFLFGGDSHRGSLGEIVMAAFFVATYGAIVWVPALLGTILVYGAPLQHARALALRGLSGEERGEKVVGVVCGVVAVVGLLFAARDPRGQSLTVVLGVVGVLAGALAAIIAGAREQRRSAFVARAAAGEEPGYRVEETGEGRVLLRVTSLGEGYRVADFEESVAEIGEMGEVTKVVG